MMPFLFAVGFKWLFFITATLSKTLCLKMDIETLKAVCIYIFDDFFLYHADRTAARHVACVVFDLQDVLM